MKRMKKLLAVLLTAVMCLSVFAGLGLTANAATIVASGNCGAFGGSLVKYTIDSEGTATISGTGNMQTYYLWSNSPFYEHRSSIRKVVVKEGVTSIGQNAFYFCSRLSSVTIPATVTTIESNAFWSCTMLLTVYYAGTQAQWNKIKIESYGNDSLISAYKYFNWGSVSILKSGQCGDNVTYRLYSDGALFITGTGPIWDFDLDPESSYASPFMNDKRITSVEIGEGVTRVGSFAFFGCSNLGSVIYPSTLKELGAGCYAYRDKIRSASLSDTIETVEDQVYYGCENLESIEISAGVKSIGTGNFNNCPALKEILVDEANRYYANDSYGVLYNKDMTRLIRYPDALEMSVYTIGKAVEQIDNRAFYDSVNLAGVYVDPNNPNYSSDDRGVLFNKDKTVLIRYPAGNNSLTYTIPDGVKSIANGAFYDCRNLVSVVMPDSVEELGFESFSYCHDLVSVSMSSNINELGNDAFENCVSLQTIIVPSGVETIGKNVFFGCFNLSAIGMFYTTTYVDYAAFGKCDNLQAIYYYGTEETLKNLYVNTEDNYNAAFMNAKLYFVEPEHNHTPEVIPGKAPTCAEPGFTDGEKCSVCGEILKEQEPIAQLPHTLVVIKGKAATCTETGLTDGEKCFVCGEILKKQETIPATGHKAETVKGKAATCTEAGLTDGEKCSVCGEILKKQETIDALGHTAPDENGKCTRCGAQITTPPTAGLRGDANLDGKVLANDARLVLRVSAKLEKLEGQGFVNCDLNGDGKLLANEARLILRFSAKLEKKI